MDHDEPLNPDDQQPDEELRRENEFLKIKLQAEFGAVFSESDSQLPADVEQQFLNNVYEFEKAWEKQELMEVRTLLKDPVFIPFEDLAAGEQEKAWSSVLDTYEAANISVDFTYDYPLEIKYRFATEELPTHQTVFVNMPEMMLGFTYEEFHPNYAADMEEATKKFIESWFERDEENCMRFLSSSLILETGAMIGAEAVGEKMKHMFDSFVRFDEPDFFIAETSYEKQETEDSETEFMLGYSEGGIRWQAVMENGEKIAMAGPFKLYFESKFNEWSILYFSMPGWKW